MKRLIFTILFSSLSAFVFGQSITLDPRTTQPAGVQVASDLAFRKQKRETVNGGWTNYPRDNSSVLIFEGGGSLNGIADGQDGLLVYVFNGYPSGPTSTGQLLIQHENLTSLAANRIMTPDGLDFPVGNGGVALIYDGTKQRWRVATPAQTGSGGSFSGWGLTGNGGTNSATNFIGTTDAQGFVVKTNGLERISVESGGDVGIGITAADSKLHVAKGSAGSATAFISSIATFENSTSGYLSILTPATSEGGILFGSPTSNSRGFLAYSHSTDKMRFVTSNNERMAIDELGNVGIGTSSPFEKLHVNGNGIITGNVAIGTTIPNAKLEVAGTYAVSGKTTFTGTQHNYNLGGKSVIHVNGGASTLTGIAGGFDGMIVHIYVGTGTDLTIANQSTSSLAANRIVTGQNTDLDILQGGGATLIYDADVSLWRLIGFKQ